MCIPAPFNNPVIRDGMRGRDKGSRSSWGGDLPATSRQPEHLALEWLLSDALSPK